jgi:hypothetical protein
MTMRLVTLAFAFMLASGPAAAADTTPQPAQPSAPVSKPADSTSPTASATKPADAAKPTSAKPVPDPKADDKTKDGDFKPSEEISEDMAVAYPVDI